MVERFIERFTNAFTNHAAWVWQDLTRPGWHSYAVLLLVVSAIFGIWEQVAPWRDQPRLREGYWLDAFYLVFNYTLFGLLGFQALSAATHGAWMDGLAALGLTHTAWLSVAYLPVGLQLVVYLVARDLAQYGVHRLLHRIPILWRFHQVHHSVRQMGFASNLRFHPMESVVYRTLEFLPMSLIGFGIDDMFLVHAFALVVGHWNHANIRIPLGPFRYVLNGPQMHIFHHARQMPFAYGANFGVVLSVWDWLFGTAWIPDDGLRTELGFDGVESYPRDAARQLVEPLRARSSGLRD
jgi:sterol desaturase/sphingolipid hydroxylase (fatty acid hydroxylase superfamily)